MAERPRPVPPRHYEEVREERHGGRIAVIAGIAVLAVLLLSYIAGLAIYHGKFLPKTYVNGVDIGGMNVEDAQNAVLGTAQDMGLTFIPKSGDPITFKGSSFGCTVTLPDNALAAPADESHAAWFKKLFSKTEYTVKVQDSYSEDALVSLIAAYDWGNVPPTDAKVVQNEDGSFTIQPEDDGNMVDTQKLSDYTIAQMREGNNTINMAESDCYKKAAVTAESLKPTLELYNKIGAVEITYDMTDREEIFDPVGTEKLDHATIMDWITTDGDDHHRRHGQGDCLGTGKYRRQVRHPGDRLQLQVQGDRGRRNYPAHRRGRHLRLENQRDCHGGKAGGLHQGRRCGHHRTGL